MTNQTRQDAIREQATTILNTFYSVLAKSKISNETIGVSRNEQTRNPQKIDKNASFRKQLFANASKKDHEYIYAESKKWDDAQ
jgi:hypothetical protein